MAEIDYKKKLKIMKRVSDIHLTENHLKSLYEIYELTGEWREYLDFPLLYVGNDNLNTWLNDLANVDLLDRIIEPPLTEKFRIATNWLQLIIKIIDEEKKSRRDRKILPRANKQSPLRPFISILIAVWALVVAIAG